MTRRSQGSPTWQLWNWQVSLVVCILVCGASIWVLAILPWSWGLLLLPLLGHPGRSRVVKGEHSGSRHLHPRLGRTYPTQSTSSAHPPCPRNLLPHCPVLLPVATQSTSLFSGSLVAASGWHPRAQPGTANSTSAALSFNPFIWIQSFPSNPEIYTQALLPQTQEFSPTLRPRAPNPNPFPSDSGFQTPILLPQTQAPDPPLLPTEIGTLTPPQLRL